MYRSKISDAVHLLATHPGTLQARLGQVYLSALGRVRVPERFQPSLDAILRGLGSGSGAEGGIPDFTARMSEDAAIEIAEKIWAFNQEVQADPGP